MTDEEKILKEVEFYSQSVSAWYQTKFERDKSLLALSSGAIGVLVALVSAANKVSDPLFYLFTSSIVCFVLCIFICLSIFTLNADHLKAVIHAKENENITDKVLDCLDYAAVILFAAGVTLSCAIGITTAIEKVNTSNLERKCEMSKDENNRQSGSDKAMLRESVSGVTEIRPSAQIEIRSVSGAGGLRPSQQTETNQPSGQASPSPGQKEK